MTFDGSRDDPTQTQRRTQFPARVARRFAWYRSSVIAVAIACGSLVAASCVDAVGVISGSPVPADLKVTQLTEAFVARFTAPERSGRFETARRRLVRGALNPSHAYADTAIWSGTIPPATRTLSAQGSLTERG